MIESYVRFALAAIHALQQAIADVLAGLFEDSRLVACKSTSGRALSRHEPLPRAQVSLLIEKKLCAKAKCSVNANHAPFGVAFSSQQSLAPPADSDRF